jgi:arylsulfatase A-like enzyme
MSPKAIKQLEAIDVEIGLIIQQLAQTGILNETTIIVTSDHGFVNTTGVVFKPGVILASLGLTGGHGQDWIAFPICSSGNCAIYINPDAPENSSQLVDDAIKLMLKDDSFNITRVYNTTEVVELEAWKGSYAILELGFTQQMDDSVSDEVLSTGGELGVHGYDPTLPEMFASFVIKGPQIQVGKTIGMVDLIDIAPTVAYLLGFEMTPPVEGRVLTEVFLNSTLAK